MRLQGGIFGLDLKLDRPQPINLTEPIFAQDFSDLESSATAGVGDEREPFVRPRGAFHPGGISLYSVQDGRNRLFAVNQREPGRTTVEIFEAREDLLTHLRTVSDEAHLISVNDLVAVGPEQFYATNDHGFRSQFLQNTELVLHYLTHVNFGSIVHFDGAVFTRVADSLAFPNGIAVDWTGGWLYVASVWGKKVMAAKWNGGNASAPLEFSREISLDYLPDNLEWDAEGALWVGAHVDLLALGAFMLGLREKSPSCVIRLTEPDADPPITAVWRNSGTHISSSSVAAAYTRPDGRKRLLIGAAFDERLLLGELS